MRKLLLILIIFLTGCATSKSPGTNIDRTFALSWGCNPEEVRTKANEYKNRLSSGQVFTPRVGWDVCELMARNGKPDDIDHQSGYGTRSATWWYGTGSYNNLWMITMKKESDGWTVDYVSH